MAEPHPKETIRKIREEVLCGKSKHRVAKELGIGITTVYRHAMDIPSHNYKRLSKEYIQKIREEVLRGKSKYQIAKDMGLGFGIVYYNTKDLPNHIYREEGIQGKTLELLKELLKNGYVISTMENTQRIRRIKRYLPIIQRAQVDGRSVYFLSDKNKVALQSMIKRKRSKIISYQELASISQVFGVNLSVIEKRNLLDRKERRVPPIIRRKDGGFLSSYRRNQMKLDDFMDEIGFLGKNSSKLRQKNHVFKNGSLLENGDSLVDFCIRMYCE